MMRAATIADLCRRLDTGAEERRRLTAILADQRAAPARSWCRGGAEINSLAGIIKRAPPAVRIFRSEA
jgi:hypothetical protein